MWSTVEDRQIYCFTSDSKSKPGGTISNLCHFKAIGNSNGSRMIFSRRRGGGLLLFWFGFGGHDTSEFFIPWFLKWAPFNTIAIAFVSLLEYISRGKLAYVFPPSILGYKRCPHPSPSVRPCLSREKHINPFEHYGSARCSNWTFFKLNIKFNFWDFWLWKLNYFSMQRAALALNFRL